MEIHYHAAGMPAPRWDGSRVIFMLSLDGRQVRCGISRGAILEACNSRYMRDRDFLPGFHSTRPRIEALAMAIFAERPEGVTGTLNIWADDVFDPPAAPAAAQVLAQRA